MQRPAKPSTPVRFRPPPPNTHADAASARTSSLPAMIPLERAMPTDNSEQIAEWNGVLGQRWVAMRQEVDRVVAPFGAAALKAAAPQPGERVIDIGCGCGDTAIEIARLVGPAGSVLGIDVSQPMLEVARSRGVSASLFAAELSRRRCFRDRASGKHRFAVLALWRDVFQPTVQRLQAFAQVIANRRPMRIRLLANAARQRVGDDAAFRRAEGAGHHAAAQRPGGARSVCLRR